MDPTAAFRTTAPIVALGLCGFLARHAGIIKSGDEKVLNSYVYYFALPALFFVNMAEMHLTMDNLRFLAAGIIPVLSSLALIAAIGRLFGLSHDVRNLMMLSCCFGSLAFFGLPFIMFAYGDPATEQIASLAAGGVSGFCLALTIMIFELNSQRGKSQADGLRQVARNLSRNPLILSVVAGLAASLAGLTLPLPVSRPLHMLGSTTATVAVFVLGAVFYGRRYSRMGTACALSLLRMVVLPLLTILTAGWMGVTGTERNILVLMNSMPAAVSLIVLSERYDFESETFASLVLVSSLASAVYLNIWNALIT